MTLTLTAAPGTGVVTLTVAGAATTGAAALSRLDRNGPAAVRPPTGVSLAAGSFTVPDWEVSLAGPARWLVVDAEGRAATAALTLVPPERPQLRPTFRPSAGLVLHTVLDLDQPRDLRVSRHDVLGRPDAVFTTYGMGLRTGTMTLRCAALADALAVVDLYERGEPALLRLPDQAGLDMHHLGTAVAPRAQPRRGDGGRWWDVVVTYSEVVPSAAASLQTWTLGDLAATYPTLAAAALAHPTLADVADNRVVL